MLKQAAVYHCEEFASGVLVNDGNNRFSFRRFALPAQFSKVSTIISDDFNKDGVNDLLIGGNFHPYRVQSGRCAASFGLLLTGNGKGDFQPVDPAESGCYIDGDVRALTTIKTTNGETLVVAAKNNDATQVLKLIQ
jgi:hypothetical protein